MNKAKPSVLAIIAARGGSKGLPGKNTRPLGDRPLIVWSIDAALGAACISRVIVSTDASEIAEVAAAAGADVPFSRPPELATDTASSVDVVAHALAECPGYDYFVLLQPTSPLRTGADIDAAFAQMQTARAEACVSVSVVEKSPWLMFRLDETGRLESLLPQWPAGMRRQDLPTTYILNGAIYFGATRAFHRHGQLVPDAAVGHVLQHEHAVDIDTLDDFDRTEVILAAHRRDVAE